jgi:hypothetical protein
LQYAGDIVFGDLCASLNTNPSIVSFIDQLDCLKVRLQLGTVDTKNPTLFWRLMRDIYKNDWHCNLRVSFNKTVSSSLEHIEFYRQSKTVKLAYLWLLRDGLEPNWTRHIDFFKFAAVHIEHRHMLLTEWSRLFPAQRPSICFEDDGSRLVLSGDIKKMISFTKKASTVRYANLDNVMPLQETLETIGYLYPMIQEIHFVDYKPSAGEKGQLLIDLRPLKHVQIVYFRPGLFLHRLNITEVLVQCQNESTVEYYRYYRSQGFLIHLFNIPNLSDSYVIKIISVNQIDIRLR